MALTQPKVVQGGTTYTLPWPDQRGGYEVDMEYRGVWSQMADGSVIEDLLSTSVKRTFSLKWSNISSTDLALVTDAYAALKASGTDGNTYVFTAPTSSTYNVTLHPDEPKLSITTQTTRDSSATKLLYTLSLKLREV